MAQFKGKANQPGRSCGPCTACCSALEIASEPGKSTTFDTGEDIAKPAGQKCRFLGSAGCTIYFARPVVCREFKCDWLIERKGFKTEDKPDEIGVIGVRGVSYHIRAG
jgi:Fe-S-cluster containining protein